MKQKMDHRVRVTHSLLKDALYKLSQTHAIQDITIKELCYEANINRTTFYSHFQSVKDLIESLESELWIELLVLIKNSEKNPDYFAHNIFNDVYHLAFKYHDLFKLLLIHNADPLFVEKVYNLGRNAFRTSYQRGLNKQDSVSMEYYYISVLNSFIGILRLWINDGMKETPEMMAELTKDIITKGVQSILENKK